MSAYKRIFIIYNPLSTGRSQIAAEQLASKLRPRLEKATIELVSTEHAGHAEELAYELSKKYCDVLLVSSSGDGGYHEMVNGAMRAQAASARPVCAVLPAGNANDHHGDASNSSLEDAIMKADIVRIDLLKVSISQGGKERLLRYAHSYAGLGLTPTVAVELNRHRLNAFRELIIVLRSFMRFRPFEIEVGGQTFVLDSIVITHIGRMAKVFNVERSELDDGVFEVTSFAHGHKLRLLLRLLRAAIAGLKPDMRTKQYAFTVKTNMPIQLDGEIITLRTGDVVKVTAARRYLRTLL